ncbi:Ig-specific serine endopeptidase MIP [Mycoplasma feriruminatoris]|uniref:Membrane-associated lipoprotein n=1 Tax=Mycoplasma feriruminatoris TaxID=1179777 RepID=A0A654IM02_9MOLU|nr:Membrane-associated lipoprotein [Mycoplasma feriruminatoris]
MRKINKLLMLISCSTLLVPLTLLVSCKQSSKKIVSRPLNDSEFLDLVNSLNTENDILKYADIKYKDPSGDLISKEQVLPTRLSNNDISIIFKDQYENQVGASVTNIKLENPNSSPILNEVIVFIEFQNTKTSKVKTKSFKISGLNAKNRYDHSSSKVIDELAYFGGEAGYTKYTNNSQKERFKFDNDKYISRLESEYGGSKNSIDLKNFRGLDTKQEDIKKFDNLAQSSNFDTYYNAALKGFTLPVYNNGQVDSLKIYDGSETIKGPSPIDSLGRIEKAKTNGLARTLPNEMYKTAAVQTFQVSFKGWKDYAQEIAEAEYYIKLFEKWDEQQIKDYISRQLWQLEQNLRYDLNLVEKDIATTNPELTTVIKGFNDKKEQLKKEYEKEKEKLSSLKRDGLVQWQKDEIEKYKRKKEEKIFQTSESGTMWIMDYLDDNGKTPTKFYFGTNSHVAKAIKDDLISVSLTRINSDVNVGQTFNLNSFDKNFTTFTFEAQENKSKISDAVTAIFHATDFINNDNNPVNFLEKDQKDKYKDAGIFADFAVVEIDFAKLLENTNYKRSIWNEKVEISDKSPREQDKLIKLITNDYQSSENKVKFESKSLLEDDFYNTFDRKLDFNQNNNEDVQKYKDLNSLYILGYPSSKEDHYLEKYYDQQQLDYQKYDYSLWVNSEYKYYKNITKKEGYTSSFKDYELEKGNFLSYQIGYRSFINKPGLTDAFLAVHRIGNDLYTLYDKDKKAMKRYFNYGLEILPRFYAPAGGASGSSVRTKDNKLLAVFHAANYVAKTGLAVVFRSNGYDYNNLFGKYKLGQYDLIYGGGKDQQTGRSYREVMKEKYNNKKSALFASGFNDIPEDYKFKDNKAK